MNEELSVKSTAFLIIALLPMILGCYLDWTNDYIYPYGMSSRVFMGPFVMITIILRIFLDNIDNALIGGLKYSVSWVLVVISLISLLYCAYETYNIYIAVEKFQISGKVEAGFSDAFTAKILLLVLLVIVNLELLEMLRINEK